MRRRLTYAPLVLGALIASPATAEPWRCHFTAECHAGLACDSTDWALDVIAADHEGQLFLTSVSGDVPVHRLGPTAYAAPDRLLSIEPDGTAFLSAHLDAVLIYFGSCEVLE